MKAPLQPMKMTANVKDSIFTTAKRAVNNANIMGRTFLLNVEGADILVYAEDSVSSVMAAINKVRITNELAILKARLG